MIARTCRVLVVLAALVACTGGGGPVAGGASTSSGATSSSGTTSSSGGSSGGSSSSGDATACTQLVGGTTTVDPAIGGSATSRVLVQAVLDFAGAATSQVGDLTVACKEIAVALDAGSSEQAAADAQTDVRAKLKAWCDLAVKAVGTTKATAGGTLTVQFVPPECGLSVQVKAECQGRCAETGPCDTNANPMTCTGGTLANGLCTGGQLEGGCLVEAKCDGGCDATVAAKASCPSPAVSVTSSGASDATAEAKLAATLEAKLPTVLSLRAHCEAEGAVASSLSGDLSAVTDIEAACIPPVVSMAGRSVQDVQACLQSALSVTGTVM